MIMNQDKLEYQCPFCYNWILKTQFNNHQQSHWNDANVSRQPANLEELKNRFGKIGLWEEK